MIGWESWNHDVCFNVFSIHAIVNCVNLSGHIDMHSFWSLLQWNLYNATTKFHGLSRWVVFHDKEYKHDLIRDCDG